MIRHVKHGDPAPIYKLTDLFVNNLPPPTSNLSHSFFVLKINDYKICCTKNKFSLIYINIHIYVYIYKNII